MFIQSHAVYMYHREGNRKCEKKERKKNDGSLQSMIVAVTGRGKKRTGKGTPNQLRENHPFARSTLFSPLCLPPFNYRSLYFDINVPRGVYR